MSTFEWYLIDNPEAQGLVQTEKTFIIQTKIKGKRLCLVRHKGELYAIDNRCPHSGGPLSQGKINEENQIVCPWHRFPFDLQTGQSESGGYFVNTYEIKCENRSVYVKMKKKRFFGF